MPRIVCALVVIALVVPAPVTAAPAATNRSWLRSPAMVAHAMGGLTITDADGVDCVYTYTNSLEAFEQNYAKGYRIFEVDLLLSRDRKLVARHSWSRTAYRSLGQPYMSRPPTRAQFLAMPIRGSYTPLDVERIAKLMRRYPDIYIITDTKSQSASSMRTHMKALRAQLGADRDRLCKRIIVQVYSEQTYRAMRSVYPFTNVIYTLYMRKTTTSRAASFARAHGIKVMVCFDYVWTSAFRSRCEDLGLAVGIHTVNSPAEAGNHFARGARFVYSDALPGRVGDAVRLPMQTPSVVQAEPIPGVW